MPHAYEKMRDKFAKGAKKDSPAYNSAQSKAAAIYNAKHPKRPMSSAHPEGAPRRAARGIINSARRSR
jgi:hypothetical protein